MTSAEVVPEVSGAPREGAGARPMRADARRNYEKLLAAGRDAFTEEGSAASLEEIARRAGVGIGTLYRHFPTRQALLEAVYVEEVDALCRSAADLADLPPWEALVSWLHRFVGYVATKQALSEELFAYIGRDSDVFHRCHTMFYAAGEPLLVRAQEAGLVRTDTNITEVVRMVAGIAKIQSATPEQIERVLTMALDGLRFTASP
jgi:AcrR family transcriptional regulator